MWQNVSDSRCRDAGATLTEFVSQRHRERFLASADKMKAVTTGVINMEPDDNAISKIKADDAKGCIRFQYRGCKSPN